MSEQGRETRDAKQMLLASGAAAVEVIVSLMQDSGLKPELRLKAAESILDRIGGKNGRRFYFKMFSIPLTPISFCSSYVNNMIFCNVKF